MAYSAEEVDILIAQAKAEIEEYVQSAIYLKMKNDGKSPTRTPQLLLEEVGNTETISAGDGGTVIIDDSNYVFVYEGIVVINDEGTFIDDLCGELLPFDQVNIYRDDRYLYVYLESELTNGQSVMYSIKSESNQGLVKEPDTPVMSMGDDDVVRIYVQSQQPVAAEDKKVLWIRPLDSTEEVELTGGDGTRYVAVQEEQPTPKHNDEILWARPIDNDE